MGVAAAQLVHAAGESSPGLLPPGTFAVVLSVAGERELVMLADRLRAGGVGFTAVFESDPPHSNQLMAIGVRPGRRSKLRKFFSSVPLYRGPHVGVGERSHPPLKGEDAGSTPAPGTVPPP